jgi:hypothetical protein
VDQSTVLKWLAVIVGAFVGYLVGDFAVGSGAHGGHAWAPFLLVGPLSLVIMAMGDGLAAQGSWPIATAMLYAVYTACMVRFRNWITPLVILAIHAHFALAIWALIASRA